MVTTTDNLKHLPFRCEVCRAKVVVLIKRYDGKQVCDACLPERERGLVVPA